jgi:predicted 3-demethylubiquinone-9 3-methyltransferase (glyoxalase superfamily)
MLSITPCLWFNNNAEEAINFYTSVIKDSRIGEVNRNSDGSVLTMTFFLKDREFLALNGGPEFKFNEAISLSVLCEDQAEVDDLWSKLTAGGEEVQCGWLKDKYGLSWQIVPRRLMELMSDPDPKKAARVTQAMLKMIKLDVAALEKAYAGD